MRDLPPFSWFDESTVKHLRIPFSYYLMPFFLFALSQASTINWLRTAIAFGIMYLLVFPSTNGYNSYEDRDETSIGGLKSPPKVSQKLLYATVLMDVAAVVGALLVSVYFSVFVLIFVLMSHAYSYRKIRLKKNPATAFLTVFIFQGAFVFLMASAAITSFSPQHFFTANNIVCMCTASLFVGSLYPLTQIYQHEADKRDGVISLSYALGYTGTFVFSSMLFLAGTLLMLYYFDSKHQILPMILFIALMTPVIVWQALWFGRVRKDSRNADFESTMTMNKLTSSATNLFFLILVLYKARI
jgi:1,4-dihydroxy-2-naphthoate octaprenyltransferase